MSSYLIAVVAVAAAVLLRWLLDPWSGGHFPLTSLYAAVAVAVWYGGYRPALAAALFGYAACTYLFAEPRGHLAIDRPEQYVGLTLYLLSCGVIIGLGERMRVARRRAESSRQDAVGRQKQLEHEVMEWKQAAAELHRAEPAWPESEQRLRLALAAGRMGAWEWDLRTNAVTWSPGLEAIHGLPAGTFPGTFAAYQNDIHPEDRTRVFDSIQRALEHGNEHHIEYRIVWPDGSLHWVEGRGRLFRDEAGKPTRMVGVCGDITERKRAEIAMQEADRRKDEFLATLAHELRNPLAPIRNAVELLRDAEDDPTLVEELRSVMERQVGQLVLLIDDLLDISRIALGKLRLRKARIELAAAVDIALESCRPLIEAQAHELALTLPQQPVYLNADPARLAQIISNLLNNAAKYTEKAGCISLRAVQEGEQAVVSVRDTGMGIAAEQLPHIFEMFSQVTPALERSQGGLGIGLALVRGLVELHGGSIEARSEGLGQGSEFIVRLPIAPEEDAGAPASATAKRDHGLHDRDGVELPV